MREDLFLQIYRFPTKRDDWVVLRGDDLRLKEGVTFRITGGAGPQGKPRPSS